MQLPHISFPALVHNHCSGMHFSEKEKDLQCCHCWGHDKLRAADGIPDVCINVPGNVAELGMAVVASTSEGRLPVDPPTTRASSASPSQQLKSKSVVRGGRVGCVCGAGDLGLMLKCRHCPARYHARCLKEPWSGGTTSVQNKPVMSSFCSLLLSLDEL